jgi:hypothetical protein
VRPDDVRGESDELGSKGRKPVELVLGIAVFQQDVLPLHIAQVTQALLEERKATPEGRR